MKTQEEIDAYNRNTDRIANMVFPMSMVALAFGPFLIGIIIGVFL